MTNEPRSPREKIGWLFKNLFLLVLLGTLLISASGGIVFWYFSRGLPEIITVEDYKPRIVTRIIGKKKPEVHIPVEPEAPKEEEQGPPVAEAEESELDEGEKTEIVVDAESPLELKDDEILMAEFYRERRYLTPFEEIPEMVVQAFISAEDSTFFDHQGVNLAAIIRASIANFKAGHVVQGGSTITQQVAKSLLLTPERSYTRKIKEVILASRIERNLSKQEILYLYLNQIYLGNGAYGVEAASRAFFNKHVQEITLGEAAILGGMPQAPGKFSPHLNPKKAKDRQLYVLRRMYENGFITQAQLSEAAAEAIPIHDAKDNKGRVGAYYSEHVRRYLLEKYGEDDVYQNGLTVRVPLTLELARASQKSLRSGLKEADKRMGYRGPLRKLQSQEEIEEFLKEQRLKLIEKKIGYHLLQPDGTLDRIASFEHKGLTREEDLLEVSETYEGVVTSVDDEQKVAGVLVGASRVEIPMSNMVWAKEAREEPGWVPPPRSPSQVVKKGDVVLVRILEKKAVEREPDKLRRGPLRPDFEGDVKAPIKIVGELDQEPVVQGALFSLDVHTGRVLAMEGGYDFTQSEFNRAVQAQRQAGSSYKPIIYSSALERGYTPASIIVDSPIVYGTEEFGKWKPTNFEEKFYGDTTFRQALIKSRNVPTIKIVQDVGVPYLIDYSRRLGMVGNLNKDLSISLGSGTVSLMELTQTYALYPRFGKKVDPIFITSIHNREGELLEEHPPQPAPLPERLPPLNFDVLAKPSPSPSPSPDRLNAAEEQLAETPNPEVTGDASEEAADNQATLLGEKPKKRWLSPYPNEEEPDRLLDPRIAYVMSHLMKEVVSHGTGKRAKGLGRPAAGKTGTTNDYLDAWFLGFTPNIVTGVWVGFDNLKSMPGETGARAALPIWLEYMRDAVPYYPTMDFPVPPGIVFANIHPGTGKLARPNDPDAMKEAFIQGTEPTQLVTSPGQRTESQTDFLKEDFE